MGELTIVTTARRVTLGVSLLAAALAACAPAPARAQFGGPDARARELYLEGDRHYQEGRYEQAVSAFQESYRLSGRPLLLFNLANAYERLGRYQEALDSLRGYLPHAPWAEQAQVRARLASLEQRAAEAPAQATPGSSGGDDTLLALGVAVGAGGLVLGVGGIVMGVLALDARGRAQAGCASADGVTLCDASARDALEEDALFALLADIGIVTGGVALAAGVVLAILGLTTTGSGGTVVAPWVAPRADGGELGVAGAF